MNPAVRCYVPACRSLLADLAAGRPLPPGTAAVAVTPGLLAVSGSPGAPVDDEEAEYAATMLAAERSVRLLDADDPRDRRRVVLAVDAAVTNAGTGAPGQVRLAGPVLLAAVAAVHVDAAGDEPLVEAAVRALADGDTDAADQALEALAGEDLAWYAPQELDSLL